MASILDYKKEDREQRHDPPEPVIYAHALPRNAVDPDAAKVIKRLTRHGYTAYLVGGGVRDLLLDRAPKDFDVATDARPNDVRRLFRNCRVIGRRFRLAHILFSGGKIIEVATFRRDPAQSFSIVEPRFAETYQVCDGERPVRLIPKNKPSVLKSDIDILIRNDNIFGQPHEDAIRRDFTINGLFYDIERGEIIDYVGGTPDIERRVVRMIGDPPVRFREDPIRIMRAIKFSARLDMGIESSVYDAIVRHAVELERAAAPRVLEEILRLLRGGAAHRSIYLAWESGVLATILPELASYLDDDALEAELTWHRLQAIDRAQSEDRLPNDTILLAALLLGPIEEALLDVPNVLEAFESFMEPVSLRLALPRRVKDRLRLLTLSQARLRRGRVQGIARREYFPEAATLFALDCESRREPVPDWASDPAAIDPEGTGRRRRRRRRRRDRSSEIDE